MTIHLTGLVFILAVFAVSLAAVYLLAVRRVRQIVAERQLIIADQLGRLDEAIRAMETRLAERYTASGDGVQHVADSAEPESESAIEEGAAEDVAPEIKAAIAAAAVAVAGPNAQVHSVKPVSAPAASPWTQQGRVMVQGSHNLRVQR